MENDWADEEADRLRKEIEGLHNCGYLVRTPGLAAALRKAKADGMREAAEMAFSYMGCLGEDSSHAKQRGDMLAHIKVAASKLSPT